MSRPAPRSRRGDFPLPLLLGIAGFVLASRGACTLAHDGTARHNKADEAIAGYSERLKEAPEDLEALRNRGCAYVEVNEEYELGLADFEKWVSLIPKTKPGHGARAWRGLARYHTGDWKGALEDLDPICSASTTFPKAWLTRCELRRDLGDLAGARSDVEVALKLAPQWPEAFVRRGQLREAAGDEAGALDDYGKALDRDPRFVEALLARALLHVSKGRFEAAAKDVGAAAEVAKVELATIPQALVDATRARKDWREGFKEDARRYAEKSVASYRKEATNSRSKHRAAECLRDAARLLVDAGQDAKAALGLVDEALVLAPDRIDLLREKVRLLDALGEKDEASETVRKKLALAEAFRLP